MMSISSRVPATCMDCSDRTVLEKPRGCVSCSDSCSVTRARSACREAVQEEPQSEGLVFDAVNDTLYVAFETIGLYKLEVTKSTPDSSG